MVGAAFGTLVCGWACPFGFLQDLLGRIPPPKFRLPGFLGGLALRCWWRCARSPLLLRRQALVLHLPPLPGGSGRGVGAHQRSAVDRHARNRLADEHQAAILIVFVIASILTWRPWCTLFCPLGAIFSVCNYVSLMFLRFQPSRCNDCDLCRDLCKYRGPAERRGSDLRCIRCLECVNCRALSVGTVFQDKKERQKARR